MAEIRKPWICPKCGRSLQIRNQEHTCGLSDFESHFTKKDALGRVAYDWICSVFDDLGEYDVLPMKTFIAFARGVNVAFLKTKKSGVEISFVLSRHLASNRVVGSTPYSKVKTIYRVIATKEEDLDKDLRSWLHEAFNNAAAP